MATHAPTTGAPTRAPLHRLRTLPNRDAIEAEIELHLTRVELLIARLDRADGDPDLEDGDQDSCALERLGEADSDTGDAILATLPLYGVDQTRDPINYRDAENARRAREMGVVPNGRDGWRIAN